MDIFGESGEDGAEVEEFVLDTLEDDGERGNGRQGFGGDAGGADEGVEFVDGAVGFDAEVIFGNALAADQSGVAGITGASIDAVEGNAGFVESGFAH
jgi:hypothetical protein